MMEAALHHGEQNNPLDHSIEAVLPGVHARMAATASEVAAVNNKIDSNFEKLESRMSEINDSMNTFMESMKVTQGALANHLIQLGEGLQGNVRGVAEHYANKGQEGHEKEQQVTPFEVAKDTDGIPVAAKAHHLEFKHKTLLSLFNEWYGLEEYHGVPIPGGIEVLEEDYKNKWRKHFSASEKKAFSRLKRVIKGINAEIERTGKLTMDVLDEWQERFEKEDRCSVSKFEEWLRRQGLITTAAPRGKNATAT